MANDYVLYLRDPRTLGLLAELSHYQSATWTRRDQELGAFELVAAAVDVDATLIARNTLLEVRRNGLFEFAGLIRSRRYDALTRTWQLTGPCLKWWLTRRTIVPAAGAEHDSVADVPAETAMKHYITAHLTAPTDSARDVHGELSGLLFDVEADSGRGETVSFNARYVNLFSGCLVPLAVAGGLLHDVVLQMTSDAYPGYRYEVSTVVDATSDTGATPVVFSSAWENVGQLTYEEDVTGLVNAVYVLGQGQGAARAVRLVTHPISVSQDFRSESAADSRNNDTQTALDLDGVAVISQSLAATVRLDAQPLVVGPTLYRAAWDVGYDVTLAVPEVGVAVDQRIVEVQVALNTSGETVTIALGSARRGAARSIAAALRRNNRVQVA